jgi:NADPH:quinone reductase-like Zn-dependent oxidoreductase
MRAVQITRFGGPEVLDVVDLPEPEPGPGRQLYEVSAAGVNFADTHHPVSSGVVNLADLATSARRPGRRGGLLDS